MNKLLSCVLLLFLCISTSISSVDEEKYLSEDLIRRYQVEYPEEFKRVVLTFKGALNKAQEIIEAYSRRTDLISAVAQLKKQQRKNNLSDCFIDQIPDLWENDNLLVTISFLEDYLAGKAKKSDFDEAHHYLDVAHTNNLLVNQVLP